MNSCWKGCLTTLKVPSIYHSLALPSNRSMALVPKIRWRSLLTVTSYGLRVARAGRQHWAPASCRQSTHMPVVPLDVPRRRLRIHAFIRNAPCAFNYIIYPIFVQCYVMGRFGHENGPFWMLAWAVLVLFFFFHWGRFGFRLSVGRLRPSLGPFWSVPWFISVNFM